jgi:hypothetical protein
VFTMTVLLLTVAGLILGGLIGAVLGGLIGRK